MQSVTEGGEELYKAMALGRNSTYLAHVFDVFTSKDKNSFRGIFKMFVHLKV